MPSPKQFEKMAAKAVVGKRAPVGPPAGPADEMPPEYWDALLKGAHADDRSVGPSVQSRKLSEIGRHLLRVSCRRCSRIIEIQKADAARLYGPNATWKDVGQRLLDETCQQRTGSHEDDGCWPSFD